MLDPGASAGQAGSGAVGANLCYYCLVRDDGDEGKDQDDEGTFVNEYVVSPLVCPRVLLDPLVANAEICLLRVFESAEVELDLFRNEMDAFCEQIATSGWLRSSDVR